MAYTGPGSVVTLANEFLTHWQAVEAALAPALFTVVPEGMTSVQEYGDLEELRDTFQAVQAQPGSAPVLPAPSPQFPSIQSLRNTEETSRAAATTGRELVAEAIGAFNRKVRGSLGHTTFPNSLPEVPPANAGAATMLKEAEDMLNVWGSINALAAGPLFTPPLVATYMLPGTSTAAALTLENATTRVNDLRDDLGAITSAEKGLATMRPLRDNLWDRQIRPLLVAYRAKVLGDFPPAHPFVASLPRIYPEPGHTPDAVNLTGAFNAATSEGEYAWSASSEAQLARYEVRQSPGPAYDADASSVLASILPGSPLTFATGAGFESPGQVSSVKVFVVLTTGNERGSNTVTLTRPA
jgi:hypothetical protein